VEPLRPEDLGESDLIFIVAIVIVFLDILSVFFFFFFFFVGMRDETLFSLCLLGSADDNPL
jgi:hypothetical protein